MSEDKRDNICPICKHFPGMMCSHDVQDWIERIADLETQLADRDRTIDILQTRLVDAGELHLADEQTVRNLEAQLAAKDAELANAKKELADWKTFTYCVYCGHEEHTDDLGEAITAHIMTCEQHPIHKAASQIADRDRTIADLQAQVGRLKGLLKELLTYLPDGMRYQYVWDECLSHERDEVKKMRARMEAELAAELNT